MSQDAMWVEILDRHQDVVVRHRLLGESWQIGRGYHNDVIVDDPSVALSQLQVQRLEAGRFRLLALPTLNGSWHMAQAGAPEQQFDEVVVDGHALVRLGEHYLRFRDASFALAPEVPFNMRQRRALWPAAIFALVLMLTLELGYQWLRLTEAPKLQLFLQPMASLLAWVMTWTAAWATINRVFARVANFEKHALIASLGLMTISAVDEVFSWLNFAWVANWSSFWNDSLRLVVGALFVVWHLRTVSTRRMGLQRFLVGTAVALTMAVMYLNSVEQQTGWGDSVQGEFKPTWMQMRSPRELDEVLQRFDRLQAEVDAARDEAPRDDEDDDDE